MAKVERYRELVRSVKRGLKDSVQSYEHELASDKRNPKRVYQYIKMRQKCKQSLELLQEEDSTVTSMPAITEIMNSHFASCFVNEPSVPDAELPLFPSRTNASVTDCCITVEDVELRLRSLDVNKSPGGDGLHCAVLKHCASSLAFPLAYIFRRSLDEGVLPNTWLEANVTPIHKKGSRTSKENYRPISLTSAVCKVMEKVVRDNVMSHLLEHGLLCNEQHGFVPRKSCTTNLLESADILTKAMADRRSIDVLYLDFAKAFDTVPHRRLLVKLAAYGVGGKLLRWVREFLARRRQRVVISNTCSEWAQVTSGVPQGSVLGPLLFTIYINDLPDMLQSICKLYADDTKLFATCAETLQLDIEAVTEWCNKWMMSLNASKCHILQVGKGEARNTYFMNTSSGRHDFRFLI